MSDKADPRWLDASAAAAYVSMTESAFRRRVSLGKFPKPNLSAGIQSPRWDRLALDASFNAGAASTDAEKAFRGAIDEIRRGKRRRSRSSAYAI